MYPVWVLARRKQEGMTMNQARQDLIHRIVNLQMETVYAEHPEMGEAVLHSAEAIVDKAIQEALNPVYRERNTLVAFIAARCGAVIKREGQPSADSELKEDFQNWWIVYFMYEGAQYSWHFPERDLDLFDSFEVVDDADPRAVWDGHSTELKYWRLRQLVSETSRQPRSETPAGQERI